MKRFVLALLVAAIPHAVLAKLPQARFEAFAVDIGRGTVRPLQSGDRVPFEVQTSCYMWRLTFDPTLEREPVSETLRLPGAANVWGSNPETSVHANRKSAVTTVYGDALSGVASNMWCVAAGDPEGPYRFEIHHDGDLVGSLNFFVGNNR